MGVIITIANQKGGVGKTITTTCMASLLTEQGYKVLTISLDPQRNFDMVAGEGIVIERDDDETPSMLHVMRGEIKIEDAIIQTRLGDLVRASNQLHQWTGGQAISKEEYLKNRDNLQALQELLDSRIVNNANTMKVLNSRLGTIKDSYDFILIDTNPSLTLLTMNSLYCADYVIIPAFPDETSTEAIIELWDTIQTIKYYNPGKRLKVLGILMTNCNTITITFKRHVRKYAQIAQGMDTRLFQTKIRKSARATDYVESGYDLIRYDPKGKTTDDYRAFVEEFKAAVAEEEGKK